ncbi:MAG: hypothetical protein EAX81_04650 [Candidatus Thorarchaeota archaeon]|nr:hypothetical protein [Candidatus Thorarchaeota archaeon]
MSSKTAKPDGCHACGSERLDWGWLGVSNPNNMVVFYGETVRRVAAYACLDCGHIQLRVETEK